MNPIMLSGVETDDVREAARDAGVDLAERPASLGKPAGVTMVGTLAQLMQFSALLATANGGDETALVKTLSGRLVVEEHPDPYFRPATQVFAFTGVALADDE